MIGIPQCNRLEPKHTLTDIFFSLLDRFFQQSLGQSQFESHTAQRIFVRHDERLVRVNCFNYCVTILANNGHAILPWYICTITLLKNCLIFYLAKCTVDISVSITQLLTGTTNDLFLHESSKPFHRWPLIFQTIFFPARRPWRTTSRTAKTWHPISILPRISRKQKYIWRRKIISNCSKSEISFIRLVLRAEIRWLSAERMEMTSDHSRSLSETREVFSSVNIQEEIR